MSNDSNRSFVKAAVSFLVWPIGIYAAWQAYKLSRAVDAGDEILAMQCRRRINTAFWCSCCAFGVFVLFFAAVITWAVCSSSFG